MRGAARVASRTFWWRLEKEEGALVGDLIYFTLHQSEAQRLWGCVSKSERRTQFTMVYHNTPMTLIKRDPDFLESVKTEVGTIGSMTQYILCWEWVLNPDWHKAIEIFFLSWWSIAPSIHLKPKKVLAVVAILGTGAFNIVFNTFYMIQSLLQ